MSEDYAELEEERPTQSISIAPGDSLDENKAPLPDSVEAQKKKRWVVSIVYGMLVVHNHLFY